MSTTYDLPVGTKVRVRPVGMLARWVAHDRDIQGEVVESWVGDDVIGVRFAPDQQGHWTLHFSKAGGIAKASADYVLELIPEATS